ncbi:hypothetical protein A2W14_04475 [Candidatus Gottesmanbacteria bacterium RBG_16_37_8]|uniref:Transcription regulator TrmB N-terminal domain-containing protein n=1 Tax=Candidatus Gottesmanbacteria bacterium RBG_16_37_8 TaxID=1798371 RepID=A0A1F5YT02_9BACT|nr:MAG: hypothetical protein A2W14_04475 [Candidatus Gottesmanbacteria bacterium RBG_16_37_8]
MNKSPQQLEDFLNLLGLNPEEKRVYSALVQVSDRTVLQIAKNANVNRTTTYRILERLKSLGMVEEIIEENRVKFRKTGADKLELLVKQQQEKVKQLNYLLPNISSLINEVSTTAQPGTKVLFYRGQQGIRQMAWNNLKCQQPLVGFTHRPYIEIVGEKFISDWLYEWMKKKMILRDIYSDTYLEVRQQFYGDKTVLFDPKGFQSRYISSKILNITHQMDIYDNVLAIYNWHEGEIFGVEIYNQKVADLHKQLFEIVWQLAKPKNR